MTIPTGKGIYIWHLDQCFGTDMERLADKLAEANFNHVSIKAQEGIWAYTHQPWYHLGEIQAIRQMLGHTGLPDFVGDMSTGKYYPEVG